MQFSLRNFFSKHSDSKDSSSGSISKDNNESFELNTFALIKEVAENSAAFAAGVLPGDILISIDGNAILDVLDYRFFACSENVTLKLFNSERKIREVTLLNKENEDLGIVFDNPLLDKNHTCQNNCIFCFIDRMPPGCRKTLYFKDDDSRLSFLQGNYITLTNLNEHDVLRICEMKLAVNVSIHTTNPSLREKMLQNTFAGKALDYFFQIVQSGVPVNVQCVLCPGINDGEELKKTISDLMKYYPAIRSVAFVPVGLTKYYKGKLIPDGEYPNGVRLFSKDEATSVIEIIDSFGEMAIGQYGDRIFYPSDEFFIISEIDIPAYEYYSPFFEQYENGVGVWRCFEYEFMRALADYFEKYGSKPEFCETSIVTGKIAALLFRQMFETYCIPADKIKILEIKNNFFGADITVTGLLAGNDILDQINGKITTTSILICTSLLKSKENVFIDDLSLEDFRNEVGVQVIVLPPDGKKFFKQIILDNNSK